MPSFEMRFDCGRGFITERLLANFLEELRHIHRLFHYPLDDLTERLALSLYGLQPLVGLHVNADRLGRHRTTLSNVHIHTRT